MCAQFGAAATLEVPDREVRRARREIESELSEIPVTVDPGTAGGSGRGLDKLTSLAEDRNDYLEEIADLLDGGVGAGGGGGSLPRPRRPGGGGLGGFGGAGGILGLLAAGAGIAAGGGGGSPSGTEITPADLITSTPVMEPWHLIGEQAAVAAADVIAEEASINPSDVIGAAASIGASALIASPAVITASDLIAQKATPDGSGSGSGSGSGTDSSTPTPAQVVEDANVGPNLVGGAATGTLTETSSGTGSGDGTDVPWGAVAGGAAGGAAGALALREVARGRVGGSPAPSGSAGIAVPSLPVLAGQSSGPGRDFVRGLFDGTGLGDSGSSRNRASEKRRSRRMSVTVDSSVRVEDRRDLDRKLRGVKKDIKNEILRELKGRGGGGFA